MIKTTKNPHWAGGERIMDGCVKRALLAAEQAELECEGWRIIAKALQAADLSEQQQKAVECALGHQISEEKLA